MGHQPVPNSSSRSWSQPPTSELPPSLPPPSFLFWAVFLFVFSRLLSPKLLSFLIQRVFPFFREKARRAILGMVANCSAHKIPHGREVLVGTLIISERFELQRAEVLIWKRYKTISRDEIPQSKWGDVKENDIETLRLKKATATPPRPWGPPGTDQTVYPACQAAPSPGKEHDDKTWQVAAHLLFLAQFKP